MKTVMLIEDDEISLYFMTEAISLLPVQLYTCKSFAEAKASLQYQVDLIISDINLGDGCLFQEAVFFPSNTKLIAVSAELTPSVISRLTAMGIHRALAKPMSIAELHKAIVTELNLDTTLGSEAALWDTQNALLALGNNLEILNTLKGLFKAELPGMLEQIKQSYMLGNFSKISETLHKLKASCGFLGANKLLAECYALDSNISQVRLDYFQKIALQTLESI
jgi:HPt (histidine-containing phosphotransfer) domain-containing protein